MKEKSKQNGNIKTDYWIDEIHDVTYDNNWNVLNGLSIVASEVTYENAVSILKSLKLTEKIDTHQALWRGLSVVV